MPLERNTSTRVTIDGTEYIYFGGTNYLSLSHNAELIKASDEAFTQLGFSAGASRLTSGESTNLLSLESELAAFAHAKSSVVLPAGFMSNLAVVDALDTVIDGWVIHTHAHGSIKSALRVSRKSVRNYSDIESLQSYLTRSEKLCIFFESIQAMTGAVTDLSCVNALLEAGHYVVLDEAHSFGVLGSTGYGAAELFAINQSELLVRTGTFSKAVGSYGGFVLGSSKLVSDIKACSDSYRASTALPPVVVAAARRALQLIQIGPGDVLGKLRKNVELVNSALTKFGHEEFRANFVPIYYVPVDSPLNLHDDLKRNQIYVPTSSNYFAASAPTGFRWTIQAGHTESDLHKLLALVESHSVLETSKM